MFIIKNVAFFNFLKTNFHQNDKFLNNSQQSLPYHFLLQNSVFSQSIFTDLK